MKVDGIQKQIFQKPMYMLSFVATSRKNERMPAIKCLSPKKERKAGEITFVGGPSSQSTIEAAKLTNAD